MKLILGSSSKFRAEELHNAGFVFDVVVPDIDEKKVRTENFRELPLLIARAKVEAILPKITEPSFLVTADVVVICNGELLEKPESKEENRKWLMNYSLHPAEIVASLVVTNTQTGKQYEGTDICMCYFNEISEKEIEDFIAEGTCLTTAGGFTDEIMMAYGKEPIASRDRRRGIPVYILKNLLSQAGWR